MSSKAKLYLDEDMSEILAGKLRKAGWDVVCVSEARRKGIADESQLTFASRADRVVITRNIEDFQYLHESCLRTGRTHAGIIICFWRPNPQVMFNKVLVVLRRVAADDWASRLEYA